MSDASTSAGQGLIVLQGNRTEDLRDLVLGWMARHPLHPLDRTVFLVQSNGIAQWLKTSIAEEQGEPGRGISLGVDVMLPARFQWQAYRSVIEAVEGEGSVPTTSPYDKTRLRWRLLALLPELLEDPRFAALARYLQDDDEQRRRYQLAERLADLFDQYQVYRADWLAAWEAGRDVLVSVTGAEEPLAEEQRWQPALWRRIAAALGPALAATHRGAVHRRFLAGARQLSARPAGLPPRLVVFGISSLPRQVLEVLAALGDLSEVILCLLNPCEHDWSEIIESREVLRRYRRQSRRSGMPDALQDDPALLHLHTHPLLAAWGKQGRDYLQLLSQYDGTDPDAFAALQQPVDLFTPPATDTLLGQLQNDILQLRPLEETRATWPAVDVGRDRSLSFQCCHSPQRELEVLHDQLLDAFAGDASLRPRDVMVMVPDINEYAPFIDAVFGQFRRDEARHIPYHIADQQQRHREPLLLALETLLSLPRLRFRASEMLDLLEVPALRERFGIGEDRLPLLARWVQGANIRWGLDAPHRESLDLPGQQDLHSWRFGLERMLLGYAVGEPATAGDDWAGVVPYDEVAGLDAALVGPLYRLVLTLETFRDALLREHRAGDWHRLLRELLDATLLPATASDERLMSRVRDSLDAWRDEIAEADLEEALPLAVVRESWLSRLDEPQLSNRFLLGRVTFATLMPMRAIPFRHICLLGMHDGAYPRRADSPDFDLMALRGQYRAGDRSRRDDDRYLFLEALLSARERFSISWCGRSVRDNSEQPPSVLVAQLRDHLASGWQFADGDSLTTEHPLQPFADAYFREDCELFTYAGEWQLPLAEATAIRPANGAAADEDPLPPWLPDVPLVLDQLGAFLRDPVSALFQQRLGIRAGEEAAELPDEEPFEFAGLSRWQQHDALLRPLAQRMAREMSDTGTLLDPSSLLAHRIGQRQRAGDYPPEPVAAALRDRLLQPLPGTLADYGELLRLYPRSLTRPVAHTVTLEQGAAAPGSLALEDMLDGLQAAGDSDADVLRVVLSASFLRGRDEKKARHPEHWRWAQILRHWPAHLALNTLTPGRPTYLLSLSRALVMRGMSAERAAMRLSRLMALWLAGMHAPLPTHPDFAFDLLTASAQRPEAPDGPDAVAALLADDALRRRWEERHEQLCERSPLLAREFPTLAALVEHPDFVAHSLALYADILDGVVDASEADA